jgi:L,D-transpeptidase ErfK/SrfK
VTVVYALLPACRVAIVVSALIGLAPAAAQLPGGQLTGGILTHTVVEGESLRAIGSRHGVDPRTLAAGNEIRLSAPLAVGRELRVDNRHIVPRELTAAGIVINVPQRMLFYGGDAGPVAFPVAVGRADWRTPLEEFFIVVKERDPAWDVPASILAEARHAGRELPPVVPPGPGNPLGKYWLGLSIAGVGVHGTNAPASIYQTATHGCIRLHPDDIESLFAQVSVGTRGRIVYEPFLLAVVGRDVYIEAHPDAYRLVSEPRDVLLARALEAGVADRIDWDDVARILSAREGIARLVRQRQLED